MTTDRPPVKFRPEELAQLTPPPQLAEGHGGPRFRELGASWLETFRAQAGLVEGQRVLDVGCGAGRMALALAPVLGESGSYDGFDVQAEPVAWCRTAIEPLWPRARFQQFDVNNGWYHPAGSLDAAALRFPYADATFDFVLMTSVCTHLLAGAARNYLAETCRVLRPGGRCLITFFILDERVHASMAAGAARHSFPYEVEPGCRVLYLEQPEKAVAYEEATLRAWCHGTGLEIVEPLRRGLWSSAYAERGPRHTQDFVIATAR
ncbi:MAG: class I SAM-dependent methyltransferase [Planctomycetota bacterium]